MRLETAGGKRVKLGNFIGKGGQGKVYRIANSNLEAAKIFDVPTKKLENKIRLLAARLGKSRQVEGGNANAAKQD